VDDWAEMFERCYETAGVTSGDRVQITPGYGLWTAGIGFQAGAELLREVEGASSEYQIIVDHQDGKDVLTLIFETDPDADKKSVEQNLKRQCKSKIGILAAAKAVDIGDLPRSEKKTARFFDNR
jgi:phenylacetate-coenzyme A ligase PaaK-like adenylate-forming protein